MNTLSSGDRVDFIPSSIEVVRLAIDTGSLGVIVADDDDDASPLLLLPFFGDVDK